MAFHGHPSFTQEIEVFERSSEENIAQLRQALIAFGFSDKDLPNIPRRWAKRHRESSYA